jgi:hypothetical protein
VSRIKQPQQYLYPAVFTPPHGGNGRWSVRFPDLAKESQVTGETLEAATLAAGVLLKQYLSPFERNRRNPPSPTPYKDIVAKKGETVQLIIAPSNLSEKTPKGNSLLEVVFCLVIMFLLGPYLSPNSSVGPTSSSEAANIISALRDFKAAVRMYDAEHPDAFSSLSRNENHLALLLDYVDNPEKASDNTYAFRVVDSVGWVGYNLDKKSSGELLEKLEGKAKSAGLLGSPSIDELPASSDVAHLYKKNDGAVWLLVYN